MTNEKEKQVKPPKMGPKLEEKPKNLSQSLKKMGNYIKKFRTILVVALILAALSSICSIIGPNKISDLTDELSKALIVNEENLNKVIIDITEDLNEDNIKNINFSKDISDEDKLIFNTFLSKINNLNPNDILKEINNLPESILNVLFKESKIDGILIKKEDKINFLRVANGINEEGKPEDIYKKIDELPSSIKKLVKPKLNIDVIEKIVIFLLVLYLLSAIFNFFQSFLMAIMSNDLAKDLRSKISIKINKLPLKFFDTHTKGDLLSRVTNDIDTVGHNLSQSLGTLVGAVTLFLGCLIMMFKTNWIMAITAILSSLLGFLFMSIVLSKSQKYFLARQKELGKLNGHIEEIYSNHNVVKAYNGSYDASITFDELNNNVFNCNKMSQFLAGLMPAMMGFIGNFGYVCVCIVGAILVVNNEITFGVIVAFMIYVRLFSSPLSQIAQAMGSMQSTLAASERVFEFLDEEEMKNESNFKKKLNPKKVVGDIEFKHVKFGYDKEKTIIKDFNCKVKHGQKIAIVGPTGAGKTTLVNLLMKFYDIDEGEILIDGISTKELTRENIHKLFIMVLQDTWLFDGTIRDNVKFNNKNVSDKTIWEALKIVGVDHFVKSLPGGLDCIIKDDDAISGGQKQLLTIARGMIEDAPFLILDEATSSVDTRTEELVQKAMDKLTKNRTSFIIAHRLSTIKNADLILVMKDGNIIEQGNHKTLMEQKGFYSELYNSQFKN